MRAHQGEMKAILKAKKVIWQGMEAKMDTVMDVGKDTLRSYQERMEVYQQRTKAYKEGMRVKLKTSQKEMKGNQEKMETAINFIQYKLEETIKTLVEDALASVDQWTQGLHEELNLQREETQLELQTSPHMGTQSLHKETDDTKKEIHSMRESTQRKFQVQLKEVEPQAGCGSHGRAGTSIGATQPLKFDELTSWAMF
jgi:hypothetical protein